MSLLLLLLLLLLLIIILHFNNAYTRVQTSNDEREEGKIENAKIKWDIPSTCLWWGGRSDENVPDQSHEIFNLMKYAAIGYNNFCRTKEVPYWEVIVSPRFQQGQEISWYVFLIRFKNTFQEISCHTPCCSTQLESAHARWTARSMARDFLKRIFESNRKYVSRNLLPLLETRRDNHSMAPLLYGKSYCNRWLHIIYYSYKHTITNHHP